MCYNWEKTRGSYKYTTNFLHWYSVILWLRFLIQYFFVVLKPRLLLTESLEWILCFPEYIFPQKISYSPYSPETNPENSFSYWYFISLCPTNLAHSSSKFPNSGSGIHLWLRNIDLLIRTKYFWILDYDRKFLHWPILFIC